MPAAPRFPDALRRVFAEAFRVADVAEPLASFDETTPAAAASRVMADAGYDAAGVRRGGHVWGYVEAPLPDSGPCGAAAVAIPATRPNAVTNTRGAATSPRTAAASGADSGSTAAGSIATAAAPHGPESGSGAST